jgi:glycosyltransferase involved in cell wall biosynthesis
MNILLLTPGINKKYNDNYYAYSNMSASGNNILAISNRENINKGGGLEYSPQIEVDGNLVIHRLFRTLREQNSFIKRTIKYVEIKKLLYRFNPNVIFCENRSNIPLAIKIKRDFRIPIVLRVEFAFNKDNPYTTIGRKRYIKNKIVGDYLGVLIGSLLWKWMCNHSDAIITCYFGDKSKRDQLVKGSKPFFYVPWPTYHTVSSEIVDRNNNRAVFIGAFDRHKNIKEFQETLPQIFKKTPVKEFYIVGSGVDLYILEKLKKAYPDRLKHITSLSRDECLKLIKSSYFSYSPATWGGWGFIGDSWAVKTPVVVTHNHYEFNDGVDSVVTSQGDISDRINELYRNKDLYENITSGGYNRFIDNHSAQKVGEQYYKICNIAIRNNSLKGTVND